MSFPHKAATNSLSFLLWWFCADRHEHLLLHKKVHVLSWKHYTGLSSWCILASFNGLKILLFPIRTGAPTLVMHQKWELAFFTNFDLLPMSQKHWVTHSVGIVKFIRRLLLRFLLWKGSTSSSMKGTSYWSWTTSPCWHWLNPARRHKVVAFINNRHITVPTKTGKLQVLPWLYPRDNRG